MKGLFRQGFSMACAAFLLDGCGTFTLPKSYILGEQNRPTPGVTNEAGLPHLELKTVTVPDYIDTTDLVRRGAANEVIASTTGRWVERVSIGLTHALANDLAKRLPNVVIETRGAYEPHRRLLVDVDRFEISETGQCILTARWRLTTADNTVAANSELGAFVVMATSSADADVSAAMTLAIGQLADKIAASLGNQAL